MKQKSMSEIMFMLLLIGTLSMGFSVTNINDPFPHIQRIQYEVYGNEGLMTTALVLQGIDMMPGPYRMPDLNAVLGAGCNITVDPSASVRFMAIQCRDVYCDHVLGGPAGRAPGETCKPLNDSRFRLALTYMWGMDDKADAIYGYCQNYLTVALGAAIPPAQAVPWHNNVDILPDTDSDIAWQILMDAGYTLGTGGDAGHLLNPDGSRVRAIDVIYRIGSLFSAFVLADFVAQVNTFFQDRGCTIGPTFTLVPISYATLMDQLMVYHDFDMVAMELDDLGLTPDWSYDLYHSSTIGQGRWNFCGFQNETMDALLDTMMYDLDADAVKDAVWEMQRLFNSDWVPLFLVSTGFVVTTWHPDLDNFIASPGIGADQNLMNWRHVHWDPDTVYSNPPYEGLIRRGMGDEPDTLSPWTDNTPYGWRILDGLCEPLMMPTQPDPSVDMPWLAHTVESEVYINVTALGIIDGMRIAYYLRNDVYWQDTGADGKVFQFTAEDCQFAFDMLKKWQVGRYERFWKNLVHTEAENPYEFVAYFNETSLWYEDYLQIASFFPKHIYYILDEMAEQAPGTYTDKKLVFDAFIPDEWDYQAWTAMGKTLWYTSTRPHYIDYYGTWSDAGLLPRDSNAPQTANVGAGAFVYDYYDDVPRIGEVHANEVYWVDGPIKSVVDAPYVVTPWDTIEYNVLIANYGYKVDGELANKTVDVIIYEDDIVTHTETDVQVNVFDWATLGPYSISAISAGYYNITVEVLQDSTVIDRYTHMTLVTIPEDVNQDVMIRLIDVYKVALAFRTSPGHPRWDPDADINGDFAVDIVDLGCVAKLFGWTGEYLPPPEPPEPQPHTVCLIVDTRNKTVVGEGCNFTLYIEIVNVTNLYSYDILLDYNATLLELVDWEIKPPGWTQAFTVPNYIAITAAGTTSPFTGNATIAEITFTARIRGNSTLDPSQSILAVDCSVTKISFVPDLSDIMISFIGDVTQDGDGKVRIDDVLAVALAFGTSYGSPPNEEGYYYEPNLDITNDLKIRVDDILATALNFGAGP